MNSSSSRVVCTHVRQPDPNSKAGFVRSLPTTLSAADVVARGKAKRIALTEQYVYAVRASMNRKAKTTKARAGTTSTKRGPGRPTKARSEGTRAVAGDGLEAAIERIVERIVEERVAAVLKAKLGGLSA